MSLKAILLLTVVAMIIYYIGREIALSFRHPSDDGLISYWNGELKAESPRTHRQMSEHLASCASCRERLDEIRRTELGPGADAPLIERKY